MKAKHSLVLAAIAGALTLINLVLWMTTPEAPPPPGRLIPVHLKDVVSFELWQGDTQVASLEANQNSGSWDLKNVLTGEVVDAADPEVVEELSAFTVRAFENPTEVKPEEAGLADLLNSRQLVVTTNDKQKFSLYLGRPSPDGKRRYVLRGSEGVVHAIDADLTRFVDMPAQAFRSREVFDLRGGSPDQIRLKTPALTVVMEKSDQGWVLTEPVRWPVEPDMAERLMRLLMGMRAQEIVADRVADLDPMGLGENAVTVTLVNGQTEQTARFGNVLTDQTGACYAWRKGRDAVYTVSSGILQLLNTADVDVFRKRMLDLLVAGGRVASIKLQNRNEGTLTFSVDDSRWVVTGAKNFAVEQEAVNDCIGVLKSLRVLRFSSETHDDLAKFGLTSPAFRLTITAPDGQQVVGLSLGPVEQGKSCYATIDGRPQIIEIDGNLAQILQRPYVQYKDRVIFEADFRQAYTVTVVTPDGKRSYLSNGGLNWQTSYPETEPVSKDAIAFLGLVRKLSSLRCVDYLSENSTSFAQFGLDRAGIRVVVTYRSNEGQQPKSLDLELGKGVRLAATGAQTRECVYARRTGDTEIFLLDAKLASDLLRVYK